MAIGSPDRCALSSADVVMGDPATVAPSQLSGVVDGGATEPEPDAGPCASSCVIFPTLILSPYVQP